MDRGTGLVRMRLQCGVVRDDYWMNGVAPERPVRCADDQHVHDSSQFMEGEALGLKVGGDMCDGCHNRMRQRGVFVTIVQEPLHLPDRSSRAAFICRGVVLRRFSPM